MNNVLLARGPDPPYLCKLLWIVSLALGFCTQFLSILLHALPPLQILFELLSSTAIIDNDIEFSAAPEKSIAEISLLLQSICFVFLPVYSVLVLAFSDFTLYRHSEQKSPLSFSNPFESRVRESDREPDEQTVEQMSGKLEKVAPVSTTASDGKQKKDRKESKEGIEYLQTSYSDESFYSPADSHCCAADKVAFSPASSVAPVALLPQLPRARATNIPKVTVSS